MTVPSEEAPANFVPAAAVIRRVQALFGLIGRKGCVDGMLSPLLNFPAQLGAGGGYWCARVWEREVEFSE